MKKQSLEMQHTTEMRKRTWSVLFLDHLDFVLSKKYQYKIGNMKKYGFTITTNVFK